MRRRASWLMMIGGVLLLIFGYLCLNYTKAEAWAHHQEAARRHGLPPPSAAIHYTGIGAVASGAGMVGFVFGRRRPTTSGGQR